MEPWLGICHFVRGEGADAETYEALAAALCSDRKAFDGAVGKLAATQDLHLLWSDDVHPASLWLARHPTETEGAKLADIVNAGTPAALGPLKLEEKEQTATPDQTSLLNIVEHELEEAEQFRPWLPLPLKALLFDDQPSGPLRTYAVLDAAVWNARGWDLRGELESSQLPWRCLFKGEAAEEHRDAGPYLIDISWEFCEPDRSMTFHHILFEEFWPLNAGIFLRTNAPMEDVWTSLRKFTRIKDEDDKWFILRFWEPEYFLYFFNFMKNAKMIRAFEAIPLFVMQIEGSAVSIQPDYPRLEVLDVDHQDQVDLMFNASTAMVAFRHLRALEAEYQRHVDDGSVFDAFQDEFGGAGMDYDDMKKGLDILYVSMAEYGPAWREKLSDSVIARCFDEHGDIDFFLTSLHGQCIFAIKNGLQPHELRLIGGIGECQDQRLR